MAVYDDNKKDLPDLDQFKNANNQFLKSIYDQAQTRRLSDRQIEAAERAWEKIKHPPKFIKFTDDQVGIMQILFNYLKRSWMGAPHSYEFVTSLNQQLIDKKQLSEKQIVALTRKMLKIKRAVMKRVWGEK